MKISWDHYSHILWTNNPNVQTSNYSLLYNVNPGLINLGCLIGKVPFKYQIMTIGGTPPKLINHGLVSSGVAISVLCSLLFSPKTTGFRRDKQRRSTNLAKRRIRTPRMMRMPRTDLPIPGGRGHW